MQLKQDQILVILDAARLKGNELHCTSYHIWKTGESVPRSPRRRRIVEPNQPLTVAVGNQGVVVVISNIDGQAHIDAM